MRTIKKIGLLDYDTSIRKRYIAPNYDLGVTYAFLKRDVNIEVKLAVFTSYESLSEYDEIYVFKNSKDLATPSSAIEGYHKLVTSEYGEGFLNRPARPFEKETEGLKPNFKCYNDILKYSILSKGHFTAWRIPFEIKNSSYQQVRLYEKKEGVFVPKDCLNEKGPYMVHDDPLNFFENPDQMETLLKLREKRQRVFFARQLDINLLKDTSKLRAILTDPFFASLRKNLVVTKIDTDFFDLVDYCLKNKVNTTQISVRVPPKTRPIDVCEIVSLCFYAKKKQSSLRIRIVNFAELAKFHKIAFYTYQLFNRSATSNFMSLYEFIAYSEYKSRSQKTVFKNNKIDFNYLSNRYGRTHTIRYLDRLFTRRPRLRKYFFEGGNLRYEQIRF